jgi:hypothetical protein
MDDGMHDQQLESGGSKLRLVWTIERVESGLYRVRRPKEEGHLVG